MFVYKYHMKVKVFYEDKTSSMGGCEIVSIFRLAWWMWLGRIKPNENPTIYHITKIETVDGTRI